LGHLGKDRNTILKFILEQCGVRIQVTQDTVQWLPFPNGTVSLDSINLGSFLGRFKDDRVPWSYVTYY